MQLGVYTELMPAKTSARLAKTRKLNEPSLKRKKAYANLWLPQVGIISTKTYYGYSRVRFRHCYSPLPFGRS